MAIGDWLRERERELEQRQKNSSQRKGSPKSPFADRLPLP